MFRYYKEAKLCYAYLSDVSSSTVEAALDLENSEFEQSAWFTRRWTLQELIAPKDLRFYNKDWTYLGSKDRLKNAICSITKIPMSILLGRDVDAEPVSRRMPWVASRQTSVQKTLHTAFSGFLTLQEAILKLSVDNSIFLWKCTETEAIHTPLWGLLAKSPAYFSRSPDVEGPGTSTMATNTAATLTGRGVNVELLMALVPNDPSESLYAAIIGIDSSDRSYGLLLKKISYLGGEFIRVGVDILLHVDGNLGTKQSRLPE
ncbi:hypothetical protein IFR05_005036 [Cadophora sp. M221]|nr:hypothetical protein IFR05_005036 [Cadophora sp. M221]